MGARIYNPTEGRFLSIDPMAGGCANSYVYAHGDPLTQQDLSGQKCHKSGWSGWDTVAAIGIGFALIGIALTGVGLFAELSAAAAAAVTVASTAVSVVGTGLDVASCAHHDQLGCVGIAFNAIGGLGSAGARVSIAVTGGTHIADGLAVSGLPAAIGAGGVDIIGGAKAISSGGCGG